jgi:hypothetical protein
MVAPPSAQSQETTLPVISGGHIEARRAAPVSGAPPAGPLNSPQVYFFSAALLLLLLNSPVTRSKFVWKI